MFDATWQISSSLRPWYGICEADHIYVAGRWYIHGSTSGWTLWSIKKLNKASGIEIWSIEEGTEGKWSEYATGICTDGSYIYVVGIDVDSGWRIEKRNLADGSLVWRKNDSTPPYDSFVAITVDDDSVYVCGNKAAKLNIMKKNKTDGETDWRIIESGENDAHALSICLHEDDLLICGHSYPNLWRSERRSKSDGARIWMKESNSSPYGYNFAYALTADSENVYISGADEQTGTTPWGLESRVLSDGDLNYYEMDDPTGQSDVAYTNNIFDSNHLIVGGFIGGSNPKWRITKNLKSDGSVVFEKLLFDAEILNGSCRSIKKSGNSIYAAGDWGYYNYDLSTGIVMKLDAGIASATKYPMPCFKRS